MVDKPNPAIWVPRRFGELGAAPETKMLHRTCRPEKCDGLMDLRRHPAPGRLSGAAVLAAGPPGPSHDAAPRAAEVDSRKVTHAATAQIARCPKIPQTAPTGPPATASPT